MTQNEIMGILRAYLAGAFGVLVTKGFLSADQADGLVTMFLGIAGISGIAVWSWLSNQLRSLLKQAETMKDVGL